MAAAHAADRDDLATLPGSISLGDQSFPGELRAEQPRHRVPRQRLVEVLGDAEVAGEAAIEADIGLLTDHQHANVRRADCRQRNQRVDRIRDAGKVDQQDVRCWFPFERTGRGADVAAAELEVAEDRG